MVRGIHDPEGFESRTADHYSRYPLDFLTDEDEARIRELQPSPFLWFVENFLAKSDGVSTEFLLEAVNASEAVLDSVKSAKLVILDKNFS